MKLNLRFPVLILVLLIIFSAGNFAQNNFPEWAKGIIWYQIFPERFANGDTTNDPSVDKVFIERDKPKIGKLPRWTSDWFTQAEWEKKSNGKFRDNLTQRRYGGDIQGIIDHLNYLKGLGIDAIYLNPVFEAVSMHKYDASCYHHIDVNFGPDPAGDIEIMKSENPENASTWKWTSADKLFLKLINEVHKRGMKIIIDGVFNHTGTQFWAFKDIVKEQSNSRFRDWYIIRSFDDPSTKKNEFDYKGWWNFKSLPEFNRSKNDLNAGPKEYIFNSTKKWMDPNNDGDPSDGIDGWRLDVARDVPIGFWNDWSTIVKSINPEAYISAELWELSPDLVGKDKPFDALMNYNFAFAVNKFFIAKKNKIKTSEFIDTLQKIDKTYDNETIQILMNLIDSHDTDRLSSMILNPDREFDHDGDERNQSYNPGKPDKEEYSIQKLIVAFQMTYKGSPMIYYGDEAGMWGADDPYDRKPMIWSELNYDDEIISPESGFSKGLGRYKVAVNQDLLDFYKKMISIRKSSQAFTCGTTNFIFHDDSTSTFAFSRKFNSDHENVQFIIVFNLGDDTSSFSVNSELPAKELITNKQLNLTGKELKIDIPSKSVRIYKQGL